jgi:hypothetical protein
LLRRLHFLDCSLSRTTHRRKHRLGPSNLRDHLLASRGYQVLAICYLDWPGAEKQQKAWLRQQLQRFHPARTAAG